MNNRDQWQASKFVFKSGRLIASRDPKQVAVASRLMADLIADAYQRTLAEYTKGKLLDLGCGEVPLYQAYKDQITDSICVDWRNTQHQNPHLDFECDLSEPLPFRNGEFDTIILSDVLEHLPQPEKLWKEISRILAKGGRLIMNVPFYYWLHEQPHDYYRYTEYALRRFVRDAELKLLRLDTIGGAPEIMADIFSKNVIRVPLLGHWLAVLTQWLSLWFGKTGVGRKLSDATKANFPFAYFLIAEKPK